VVSEGSGVGNWSGKSVDDSAFWLNRRPAIFQIINETHSVFKAYYSFTLNLRHHSLVQQPIQKVVRRLLTLGNRQTPLSFGPRFNRRNNRLVSNLVVFIFHVLFELM